MIRWFKRFEDAQEFKLANLKSKLVAWPYPNSSYDAYGVFVPMVSQ